jgi:putative transcriptional regulator
MKLKDLSETTGIAVNNLSILKTNKARAIRFSTLEALCKALNCTPGDLIEYIPE